MCNSIETAQEMHYKAVCQDLINTNLLTDYKTCAEKCNGIGAEWFPKWLRWGISKINKSLVPTSWIHDREYDIGGGVIDRWKADWHWLRNGCKAAIAEYSWKQAGRYIVAGKSIMFWALLRIGGQAAFNWKRGGNDE